MSIPSPIVGVTTENLKGNLVAISKAVETIGAYRTPTVRVVLQLELDPKTEYLEAIKKLHGADGSPRLAYVMGEIADSDFLWKFNHGHDNVPVDLMARLKLFLDALGDFVDVWEIGNEINGEWAGWRTAAKCNGEYTRDYRPNRMSAMRATVASQTSAIYDVVTAHRKTKGTALTMYFYTSKTEACWPDVLKTSDCQAFTVRGQDYEMLTWLHDHKLQAPAFCPDYVLLSVYEDDCDRIKIPVEDWIAIFNQLQTAFPKSKVGFGETGAQCNRRCEKRQRENVRQHYRTLHLKITEKIKSQQLPIDYVGGYFNWYFDTYMLSPESKVLCELVEAVKKWPRD
jgi:hypothetical protein